MAVDEKEVSAPEDPRVGELVGRLSDDTVRLVRDEIRLATAEMSQKAKAAGIGAGLFGGAGVFAIYGVGALVAAAVIALSLVVAPWAAALIIAGALFAMAGIVALLGKRELGMAGPPLPTEAVQSTKRGRGRIQARPAIMSATEDPDSIEAVRTDIEATRADLVETVNELSDRLNPAKRVAAVSQSASDTTEHVVEQAGDLTKDAAAKAQNVAKASVNRSRQMSGDRQKQLFGSALLVVGLVVVWRLWRRRQ